MINYLKRKSLYFSLVVIALLPACKIQQEAVKTTISIPETFSDNANRIFIDSLRNDSIVPGTNWKTFFTDPMLAKLIDTALVRNFDVQTAYGRIMQQQAELRWTKGIRLPDLGLNLSAGTRKFGDYTIDGVGNYDTQFSPNLTEKQQLPNPVPDFYAGLFSSWEIDLWGKLKNRKKAAVARYLASEQGRNLVLTNVIAETARSYYSLMLLDEEIKIIRESIVLQENALLSVQAQKETGKTNQLAIELISAQVLGAKALLAEAEQAVISEENRLNFLLGRYPQKIERAVFDRTKSITMIPATGIPGELLENRPDIKAAEYELMARNADVKSAKAAFYPALTLNANLGYQSFRAAFLFETPVSIAYNVAGGLVTPLLNRRTLKAELMQNKASQRVAYIQYEKVIMGSFTEVYELILLREKMKEIQNLKGEQVDILKMSIETSKALFLSGRASYLEIITAQEHYLQTQMELLRVFDKQNNNNVQLYRALGGGWQ